MSLEDEECIIPKYDHAFIMKVGGLLQILYEDYGGEGDFGVGNPFEGETFESVYNKVKELDEQEKDRNDEEVYYDKPKMDEVYWTEPRMDFLMSDLVYWYYFTRVKKMTMEMFLKSNDDKETMVFKWALINDYQKFYWFDDLVEKFGLKDKSWVKQLRGADIVRHNIGMNDLGEYFNLKNLILYSGHLNQSSIDISFIPRLANLTMLELYRFENIDISVLSCATKLTYLELVHLGITDISPLANLTKLTRLELHENQITDISALSSLTMLEDLGLYENKVIDVSPLSRLTKLRLLNLARNEIIDISPLAHLPKLVSLCAYGNKIVNVPLTGLSSLEQLYLSSNQIVDISPLENLVNLTDLNLNNNQIIDASPIERNVNLRNVCLAGNPIAPHVIDSFHNRYNHQSNGNGNDADADGESDSDEDSSTDDEDAGSET